MGDVAVGAVQVFEEQDGAAEFDPGLVVVEVEWALEAWGKVIGLGGWGTCRFLHFAALRSK
jgi:hypothetical protein